MPKQFLPLVGDYSTYQQALQRVGDRELFVEPIVMTSHDFRFFARRQADELGMSATIVLEPLRRDSGPAIAAGAAVARLRDPDAIVLTVAADHVIADTDLFFAACRTALAAAARGHIVTFGIRPSSPKTSYGYIRPGEVLDVDGARAVAAFVEKPDAATAERYVADGYLWNSGNFMFRAETLLRELERFEPDMAQAAQAAAATANTDLGFVRLDADAFRMSPQKSIDYAVMERSDLVAVVEGTFRWSDIGSWDAILDVVDRDASGNALRGPVTAIDSNDCIIHTDGRLIAAVGIDDLVVVSTADAVLIVPRRRAEEVKHLVTLLKEQRRTEATDHHRCHRPWGYYESVDAGQRFQVKRIVVLPGERLSLQKHMHRAEHWVVVHGTAEVTCGESIRIIHENESVYIPIGAVHRLGNPGKIPLELIEVQTGSYLGEDDITRLDDVYQRS